MLSYSWYFEPIDGIADFQSQNYKIEKIKFRYSKLIN